MYKRFHLLQKIDRSARFVALRSVTLGELPYEPGDEVDISDISPRRLRQLLTWRFIAMLDDEDVKALDERNEKAVEEVSDPPTSPDVQEIEADPPVE